MKKIYLIIILGCLWFNSFSQTKRLPLMPASNVAAFKLPADMSKIVSTSLPDRVDLGIPTQSSLYSYFTKDRANGDYYKTGEMLLRVIGISKPISVEYMQEM